jgi:hypothetical protein
MVPNPGGFQTRTGRQKQVELVIIQVKDHILHRGHNVPLKTARNNPVPVRSVHHLHDVLGLKNCAEFVKIKTPTNPPLYPPLTTLSRKAVYGRAVVHDE